MIPTPFHFEPELSPDEFMKIGQLSLRWSHTEHIVGNCLRAMLDLSMEEAIIMIFPLSLEHRLRRMKEIAAIRPLNQQAKAALDELQIIMKGIQYVRNSVAHAIVEEHDEEGHVFHLRSKQRTLTKKEIFSAVELTNYAGHVTLALRYALGGKDFPDGHGYTLPERPEIPAFLQELIPTRKK
jgi:hypothetical protein